MTYHVITISEDEAHIVTGNCEPYLDSCIALRDMLDSSDGRASTCAAMLARILNADMNEEDVCDAIALFQERKNRFEDCPF